MPKPAPAPATRPGDDELDFSTAPRPAKASSVHPVTALGTKEPRNQGTLPPSLQRPKLGTRVPADLKRRLKLAAAAHERTQDDIVAEALTDWLTTHPWKP